MIQNRERPTGCRNCGTKWLFPLVLALPLLAGLLMRPQQLQALAPEQTQVAGVTTDNTAATPPIAQTAPEPVAQAEPAPPTAEPPAPPPAEPAPPAAEPPAPAAVEPAPVAAAEPACAVLSVSTTTPGATIEIMDGDTVLATQSGPDANFDCLKATQVQVKVSAPGYADFLDAVTLPHEAMMVKLEPNPMGK